MIIRIPGRHHGYGAGNIINMGFARPTVKVTRYLCSNCGYVEEWIDDPSDIQRLKNKYMIRK